MPKNPPMAVKITEEKESRLSPHKRGIKLPIVPPMIVRRMMVCLVFIVKVYVTWHIS
jgi:hypothetical protein